MSTFLYDAAKFEALSHMLVRGTNDQRQSACDRIFMMEIPPEVTGTDFFITTAERAMHYLSYQVVAVASDLKKAAQCYNKLNALLPRPQLIGRNLQAGYCVGPSRLLTSQKRPQQQHVNASRVQPGARRTGETHGNTKRPPMNRNGNPGVPQGRSRQVSTPNSYNQEQRHYDSSPGSGQPPHNSNQPALNNYHPSATSSRHPPFTDNARSPVDQFSPPFQASASEGSLLMTQTNGPPQALFNGSGPLQMPATGFSSGTVDASHLTQQSNVMGPQYDPSGNKRLRRTLPPYNSSTAAPPVIDLTEENNFDVHSRNIVPNTFPLAAAPYGHPENYYNHLRPMSSEATMAPIGAVVPVAQRAPMASMEQSARVDPMTLDVSIASMPPLATMTPVAPTGTVGQMLQRTPMDPMPQRESMAPGALMEQYVPVDSMTLGISIAPMAPSGTVAPTAPMGTFASMPQRAPMASMEQLAAAPISPTAPWAPATPAALVPSVSPSPNPSPTFEEDMERIMREMEEGARNAASSDHQDN